MFESLFTDFNYLHWIVIGVVILIFELIGAGGFLFWTGLAAIITSIVVCLIPTLGWPIQILIFAVLTVIVTFCWWKYLKTHPFEKKSDAPNLNQRNKRYIGRVFTLDEAIVNGRGNVRVDDSRWRVECDKDYPAGTKIEITGADGVVLKGTKADKEGE